MFHAGYERSPLPPDRPDTAPRPVSSAPEATPTGPGGSGSAGRRDAFFDNAKFLAIVLVVVGHAWGPLLSDSRAVQAAYNFVYAFHMPAFIVLSGYLSRNFDMRPGRLRRLVTTVVVPYVVFETAYTLYRRVGDSVDHPISLLDPWYLSWFLLALFVWRLTTPLWQVVRWPVPLAVGISLLASVSPQTGGDLHLQRILQFLPFFVIGLNLRREHFELLRHRAVRWAAGLVLPAALVFAYWSVPRMNPSWFYRNNSGQELGVPWWTGASMTLALTVCSLVLAACFLALVPRRRTWFTALGTGTLYAYLLHGFFILTARFLGWYDVAWVATPAGEIAVSAVFTVLAVVLCTPLVRRLARPVVEPNVEWLFREPGSGPTGPTGAGPDRERSASAPRDPVRR
ncbi:acyltransferase family protein [Streptomyces sp. TRM43335]|uniref:Acyltransferase family protein n=1 Tax=Streptomyces taklimakanensis TaxID=2569853 RepID=A0A6G2B9U7_9ACTN|nr:acyltransferase family protein [Streptomyces taklimakanensis]MTE19055.1 acyltransferase family protein [Streptomyces taklimakanensis]